MATVIHFIKSKKDLFAIYITDYSTEFIRDEINKIISEKRNLSPEASVFCKLISTDEVISFVKKYPLPLGFELSDELKQRVNSK